MTSLSCNTLNIKEKRDIMHDYLIAISLSTREIEVFMNDNSYKAGDLIRYSNGVGTRSQICFCILAHLSHAKASTIRELMIADCITTKTNNNIEDSIKQDLSYNIKLLKGIIKFFHNHIMTLPMKHQKEPEIIQIDDDDDDDVVIIQIDDKNKKDNSEDQEQYLKKKNVIPFQKINSSTVPSNCCLSKDQLDVIQDCLQTVPDGEVHFHKFIQRKRLHSLLPHHETNSSSSSMHDTKRSNCKNLVNKEKMDNIAAQNKYLSNSSTNTESTIFSHDKNCLKSTDNQNETDKSLDVIYVPFKRPVLKQLSKE